MRWTRSLARLVLPTVMAKEHPYTQSANLAQQLTPFTSPSSCVRWRVTNGFKRLQQGLERDQPTFDLMILVLLLCRSHRFLSRTPSFGFWIMKVDEFSGTFVRSR